MRTLYDISWQVDEPTYREGPALSYSTLAKYERSGFNGISTLADKVESPSLTFGSAVDAIITGGQEEFDKNFLVAHIIMPTPAALPIVKSLYENEHDSYQTIEDIPAETIGRYVTEFNYQPNWKLETRIRVIKEQGSSYFDTMHVANGRTIIDCDTYQDIQNTVEALKTSNATKFYFSPNNPFTPRFFREYQLKFKASFNNVNYKCMADLIITDYENRIVYPIDLKTSSKPEWSFYKSFLEWNYDIQARLYWRIIRDNMDKDPYFEEFHLAPYTFIVANRKSLTPLVWKFEDTTAEGTLLYGKNKQLERRDPFIIGEELQYYLEQQPKVPKDIYIDTPNSITQFLNNY